MLTRTGGYALHAALAIARMHGEDGPVRAQDVAAELEIPANYLAKILQSLARSGILVSERGRNGGFRLSRPPEQVTLMEVVEVFENLGTTRQCLLGRGTCSDQNGCPAHDEWKAASAPAFRFFETRTLADLMGPSR
jgi:Rrf2 family protein